MDLVFVRLLNKLLIKVGCKDQNRLQKHCSLIAEYLSRYCSSFSCELGRPSFLVLNIINLLMFSELSCNLLQSNSSIKCQHGNRSC